VLYETHDRTRLKQLCRHVTRPAKADERVRYEGEREAVQRLIATGRDGPTHF
jgi:hypothetical protein